MIFQLALTMNQLRLTFFGITFVLLLGLYVVLTAWYEKRMLANPYRKLFSDLCLLHELSPRQIKWLRASARKNGLAGPHVLFSNPDAWPNLSELPDKKFVKQLKTKLFTP